MNWWDLVTWIGTPAGAALIAWLGRRRIGATTHWIRRRLAAETNLATCQEELQKQAESFARQEAGLMREIVQRERERDSLAAALKQLSDAVDVVNEARNVGVLTPSLTVPVRSPPNSSPGPTTRRVKRAAKLAHSPSPRPAVSIPRKKAAPDEPTS